MKESRTLLLVALVSLGFVLSSCAGWQEPDGSSGSYPPPMSGGGHHH